MSQKSSIIASERQKCALASATTEMLAEILPGMLIKMNRGGQIVLHVSHDFTNIRIEPPPDAFQVCVGDLAK